jgi:hypothetical protein
MPKKIVSLSCYMKEHYAAGGLIRGASQKVLKVSNKKKKNN